MRRVVRDRWVAALRSGEFQQGQFRLRQTRGDVTQLCCLGVLCELAVADGVLTSETLGALDGARLTVYGDRHAVTTLPVEVIRWAGLGHRDPVIAGFPLTLLNDGADDDDVRRHTFDEIADLIEEHEPVEEDE